MLIYKVTNLINNKVYIGLTTRTLNHRKQRHLYDSKRTKYNSYFHAAIRKYGEDNFQWEIIKIAQNKEQLKQFEVEEISKHNSNNPEFGYNLTKGGESLPGKDNPFYGKTHSEETKSKWSKLRKGQNIGSDNYFYDKHLTGEQNGFYGKVPTKEHRSKIGEANSKQFKVTIDNQDYFIIKNLHTFCIENNLNYHSVKLCIANNRFYKKKYHFEKL